jgi:hypothetical protein
MDRIPIFSFHYLNKPEHLIRALAGGVLIIVRHCVIGGEIFAPELVYLKAAFVNVEVDIPLLKIWRAGLPHLGFGVQSLNGKPRAVSYSSTVRIGRNEKDLKMIVIRFFVDLQYHAADVFAVNHNAVCFIVRIVDALLDRLAGNDLTFKVHVIVTLAKFYECTVLERPLIVNDKLLAVVSRQRNESYFCVFHITSKNKTRALPKQ